VSSKARDNGKMGSGILTQSGELSECMAAGAVLGHLSFSALLAPLVFSPQGGDQLGQGERRMIEQKFSRW
jgi:hypothetical protein